MQQYSHQKLLKSDNIWQSHSQQRTAFFTPRVYKQSTILLNNFSQILPDDMSDCWYNT